MVTQHNSAVWPVPLVSMLTAIPPMQWQPWIAVSSLLGLIITAHALSTCHTAELCYTVHFAKAVLYSCSHSYHKCGAVKCAFVPSLGVNDGVKYHLWYRLHAWLCHVGVLTRTKQLFLAATAWMKWLCACIRYWLYSRVVLCDHCFQMVYFNTTYCSLLDCSLRVKTGYCILNISLFKTDQTVLFFWKVNCRSCLMLCHDYTCQVHKKREFKQKLDTFTSLIITITLTYFVVLIILLIPGF